MNLPIYMDNHSTTPVDPAVLEAMLPYFKDEFGNASSKSHAFGRRAEEAVEEARAEIAKSIGAESADEIVFTSGTTESNNLALRGVAAIFREKGNHIITSAIEHRSVLDPLRALERDGFRVSFIPVNREGVIDLECLKREITDETILISVMHANNEIGTIQPIREIGRIAKAHGIFFHTDAAQSVGKIPFDVRLMEIDLASFSAHKIYGPKGIGALYVRKRNPRVRLEPILYGGGQERGFRSGTPNVPAIVGFAKALEIAEWKLQEEGKRVFRLRERLRTGLMSKLDHVEVNGSLTERLPSNLNMSFEFVDGESLLKGITEKVAVSSGSACASADQEPSYVLQALGVPEGLIHTSIRFGLGRFNTEEEVDEAIRHVVQVVKELRKSSPLYEMKRG